VRAAGPAATPLTFIAQEPHMPTRHA
jgi:hypothetical protein